MIDRAGVVASAVLQVVRARGTGAEALAEVVAILRDEIQDIQRQTRNEVRRQDE
jgi:hypothetical protein